MVNRGLVLGIALFAQAGLGLAQAEVPYAGVPVSTDHPITRVNMSGLPEGPEGNGQNGSSGRMPIAVGGSQTGNAPLPVMPLASDVLGPPAPPATPSLPEERIAPDPYSGNCCWWIRPEYLLWWVKNGPIPVPLVSTGALNAFDSSVLFGNSTFSYNSLSGGRLTGGLYLDRYDIFGLEAGGFLLAKSTTRTTISSNRAGLPPLGIPFFNPDTGAEDFADFATPFQTVGKIDVSSSSQLGGAESNLTFNLSRNGLFKFDMLGGFRYLSLREDLQIMGTTAPQFGQQVAFGGAFFNPPAQTRTTDRFVTTNDFFGGQIGAQAEFRCGGFFLDVTGKLALGETHELVRISGTSELLAGPVVGRTLPGGILALPSNSGHISDDELTIVPEVEAKIGYQLGRHVTATVGYNFMYWSRVVRPGDQINRILSPEQIPTFAQFGLPGRTAQPAPTLTSTDFWTQGLSLGLEFQF